MSSQPIPANLQTESDQDAPGQHAPGQHAPGLHDAGLHDAGQHDADAQYYRHVLHDLIDMGAGLARHLHQQVTAPAHAAPQAPGPQPAPTPAPDFAIAFDRIARAVRRSIVLARSLADPIPPASDPAQLRTAARRRILREVEDVIQRTTPGFDDAASDAAGAGDDSAEALTAELHDRLDAPDLDDDISSRPVAEIITEICRDLGLAALPGAHPWHRRTPADLEQLRARAAAPSRARPPGAGPQSVPATPQPAPANPAPPGPAATPHATGPIHAGNAPPDDPAGMPARIATILRHPKHLRGPWRPPPEPPATAPP